MVVEQALQGIDHDIEAVVPFELVLNIHKILVQRIQPLGEEHAYRVAHARRRFKKREGIRDDAKRAWPDGANRRRMRDFEKGGHFSEDDPALGGRGDGNPIPKDLDSSLHEEKQAAGLVALADDILPSGKLLELSAMKQFHDV